MEGLTYTKVGDYLIPDLKLDGEDEMEEMPLGRYGRMRSDYLREHHSGTYTSMLLMGELPEHLMEIDRQAQELEDRIVADMMKQNGVDESLKARDQMAWVQAVNSYTAQAREQVLSEIVYS